jgi:hypothetical protein
MACTPNESGDNGVKPDNYGQRKSVKFYDLKIGFRDPDMIYAPFVFWFWDEPLNSEKMAEMSQVMASEGFNPGYAHARHSMVGTPSLPDSEWLGEKWFASFSAALGEAEKAGKYLGYCDEYWWPSFQANGRVLKQNPELKAESLRWNLIDAPGGSEVNIPACYFAVAAEMEKPLEPLPPAVKLGKWIWHPDAVQETHTCYFRYTFEIPDPAGVRIARIRFTVDNQVKLYLNGNPAGESENWEKPVILDIRPDLLKGSNLIAAECKNLDGPFGLIAGIQLVMNDGTTLELASCGDWKTSLVRQNGWEKGGFNDKNWKNAREIAGAGDNPWSGITNSEHFRPATIKSASLKMIGTGEAFTWKVPEGGMWRIYVFDKYFNPGAADGQQCNSIDTRLAGAFIKIALEPYENQYPDKLGKSIPGDFIDHEGDYGWQLAWSGSLDSLFLARYGTDIRQWMPLMLDEDSEGTYAKTRWQWFDLVSELYAGTFQQITDWHEQRGMYTTAHVWEEGIQPQVNCVGDHLRILRSLTMPGQDCLGLKALRVHDFKEPQSVSEFENKRFASEVLGAGNFEPGYGLWGTFTPSLLKQSVNAFTAWGVSHVIPHGVFTTRQLKGNPWPPDWYNENPMFPWLHHWTDFTRRTSYINSMGHAVPDVLVYNPMETAWMYANGPLLDANGMWSFSEEFPNGQKINEIDKVYTGVINDLTAARVEFLVGDRYYLDQMRVRKGILTFGNFEFKTVVLPSVEIISLENARKILAFARSGGKVYVLGELPVASVENGKNDPEMARLMDQLRQNENFISGKETLKPWIESLAEGLTTRVRFLSGEFPLLQERRKIDGRDFIWLANNQEVAQNCKLELDGIRGAASIWNCETGEITPVPSWDTMSGSRIVLKFKPLEAFWLVFEPEKPATKNEQVVLTQYKILDTITGQWNVKIDPDIQPMLEFPVPVAEEFKKGTIKPLADWKHWGLERFSGIVDYSSVFTLESVGKQLQLNLGTVNHVAEVWINGVSAGSRMWAPFTFDITNLVKPGENEIRIRVANLVNNSYGDLKPSGLMGPVYMIEKESDIK